MAAALHAWFRPLPTNWKKPSCAANGASLSKLAWPTLEKRSRCSRWFAARRRSAATIPAPVDRARSTRNATAPECRLCSDLCDPAWKRRRAAFRSPRFATGNVTRRRDPQPGRLSHERAPGLVSAIRSRRPEFSRPGNSTPAWDRAERHLRRFAPVFILPIRKQRRVILGDVLSPPHAQLFRGRIDPPRRSFNLAEITDGSVVDDHLAFPVAPLLAEFLVTE